MAGTCMCAGEKAHGKVPTRLKSVISWHRAAVQCVPGLSAPHVPRWPMEEELMMVLSTASWQLCRKSGCIVQKCAYIAVLFSK